MTESYQVVSMRKEHIESILEIEALSFADPWTRHAFEQELHSPLALYRVLEETENGRVWAYGGMWKVLEEGHITNIAVHPQKRGQGLGHQLLQALVEDARKENLERLTLEVRRSNHIAQSLYRQYGFVLAGVRTQYYRDNQEDALIMWAAL